MPSRPVCPFVSLCCGRTGQRARSRFSLASFAGLQDVKRTNEQTYYLANGADRPVTPESFATQEFGRRGRRLATTDEAKQHQSVQSVAFLPRQFENTDSKQDEILKNFKPCLGHQDFKSSREISLCKERGGVRFLPRLIDELNKNRNFSACGRANLVLRRLGTYSNRR